MNVEDLQQGDWFVLEGVTYHSVRYVISNTGNGIISSSPKWLVSNADYFSYEKINRLQYKIGYLGRGKPKWYWKFLPWRDCVCPFTRPQNNDKINYCW